MKVSTSFTTLTKLLFPRSLYFCIKRKKGGFPKKLPASFKQATSNILTLSHEYFMVSKHLFDASAKFDRLKSCTKNLLSK